MAWRMENYTHGLDEDICLLHLANKHEYQMCNDELSLTFQCLQMFSSII